MIKIKSKPAMLVAIFLILAILVFSVIKYIFQNINCVTFTVPSTYSKVKMQTHGYSMPANLMVFNNGDVLIYNSENINSHLIISDELDITDMTITECGDNNELNFLIALSDGSVKQCTSLKIDNSLNYNFCPISYQISNAVQCYNYEYDNVILTSDLILYYFNNQFNKQLYQYDLKTNCNISNTTDIKKIVCTSSLTGILTQLGELYLIDYNNGIPLKEFKKVNINPIIDICNQRKNIYAAYNSIDADNCITSKAKMFYNCTQQGAYDYGWKTNNVQKIYSANRSLFYIDSIGHINISGATFEYLNFNIKTKYDTIEKKYQLYNITDIFTSESVDQIYIQQNNEFVVLS